MLSISGAPNVEGLTIDTAAQDHKIIDKWANGLRDVSIYFCVLMIYCVLNNIRFKIFLKEHMIIGCSVLYEPCHFRCIFSWYI